MINHARCLLMDLLGDNGILGLPGDEFIDPKYKPRALPTYIQVVRGLLFSQNPDRVMRNYRTRQYLTLLHSTELVGFLTDLDPRITYRVNSSDFMDEAVFQPRAYKGSGPPAASLTVLGRPIPPDATGKMRNVLEVDVPVTGTVTVRVPQGQIVVSELIGTDVTNSIPLAGTGYSFNLSRNQVQNWLVEVINRPVRDLGQITASLGQAGEPVLDQLLGFDSTEPFATFRRLWQQKEELPLKLGGLLCALIYRMDPLPELPLGTAKP